MLSGLWLLAGCTGASRPAAVAGEPTYRRSEVTGIVAAIRQIDTTEGIDRLEAVEIGGIRQWLSIRGRHRSNPMLLFVHGGPGSPTMPSAWAFQAPWEEFFTVVQWDQRGAGKTATGTDRPAVTPTITEERMIADGEEVVRYLLATFDQPKLFLLGHSWGTVIGTNIAHRHPEWLYAYIGMGQVANSLASERLGYAFALREARARRDSTAVRELEALEPYPDPDGKVPVAKILTQRKWVIAYGGLTWKRSDFNYDLDAAKLSPEYTAADLDAPEDLGSLTQLIDALGSIRYDETMLEFGCPVFVLAGKYDYETASATAKSWFDRIRAPRKGFVWFEHSAHMIPFEEPGKLLVHLVQDVRPLAGPIPDPAPSFPAPEPR